MKKWAALMSASARRRQLAWWSTQANVMDIKRVTKFLEKKVFEKISNRLFKCDVVKQLVLKVKPLKDIQEDGSLIDSVLLNEVTCQVIRHGQDEKYAGVVILHAHGSGFVTARPVVHQYYLRQIAQSMPGVTVITPDYRLAPEHKYPAGLQDMVDIYLALTGKAESNVRDTLGFEVTKVLLFGDSAGGNLNLAMCRVLNELQLELPRAMLSSFPCGTVDFTELSPSRVLMMTDSALPAANIFAMIDAYTPGKEIDYSKDRTPWYRRDAKEIHERVQEIKLKSRVDPFINPMLGSFDIFANTKLVVIPCEFDPILDDAIEMAQKWPSGQVELIIARGVPHGYLLNFSRDGKIAFQATIEKLKELVEYLVEN